MNYQHHFHAGNHADVLKHLVLMQLLSLMQQKPGAFLVLDTHAGDGAYDMDAAEARRSDEASGGIGRLRAVVEQEGAVPPALVGQYLDRVEEFGRRTYPGSPLLAVAHLRAQDRFLGVEIVPKVARELERHLAAYSTGDGGLGRRRRMTRCDEGLRALKSDLPPIERRGLILIDPPYEQVSEREDITLALEAGLQRFETGVFVLWYPLKQRAFLDRWLRRIARLTTRPVLTIENSIYRDEPGNRLTGSGVLIISPPWQLDTLFQPTLTFLNQTLRQDDAAPASLNWLNPPA